MRTRKKPEGEKLTLYPEPIQTKVVETRRDEKGVEFQLQTMAGEELFTYQWHSKAEGARLHRLASDEKTIPGTCWKLGSTITKTVQVVEGGKRVDREPEIEEHAPNAGEIKVVEQSNPATMALGPSKVDASPEALMDAITVAHCLDESAKYTECRDRVREIFNIIPGPILLPPARLQTAEFFARLGEALSRSLPKNGPERWIVTNWDRGEKLCEMAYEKVAALLNERFPERRKSKSAWQDQINALGLWMDRQGPVPRKQS